MSNQNPEQIARDRIDKQLTACGWLIKSIKQVNLNAGIGVAVKEYLTDVGPADYVLFVEGKPCGVIEAKREEEGHRISVHEGQGEEYAKAKLKHLKNEPLPFVYISTGEVTRFTDFTDPKPRAREVFSFHRPETLRDWVKRGKSLRKRLLDLPALQTEGLHDCQINAINKLETSFKENRPRALIQMATGSGKTFTAITFIYRLLKYAKAKRVLFLVDTRNLGEQAEQEFMSFVPNDDNRKFTELYGVQRLKSSYIATDSQVCISTIQRLYSILKGTELEESAEEENPNERKYQPKEIPPVEYDPKMPIEFFDFIVIDECHRSIYNLWKQVLEYYDAFEIGLTATPDKRTIGYFDKNLVSEYSHEMAVADGVNVGYEVFIIDTKVTQQGATLWKGEYIEHRERLSRKKRMELQDEDENYSKQQLDKDVVNPNQIRTIIRTFKEHLPDIFKDRFDKNGNFEVPKTLIFAKTDSHANDIIDIVREEFAEENKFCKKITYTAEDPKSTLAQFRNDYHPRIAVTVDMIATGTDVKPLECLLFMRDVKSRNYFEQMKGRGTRTLDIDDLRKVTPSAVSAKTHYVIAAAIGVTRSLKTASQPLITKPTVPLKDLAMQVMMGATDEDTVSSLAGRLARLNKQLDPDDQRRIREAAGGMELTQLVGRLFGAIDADNIEARALELAKQPIGSDPGDDKRQQAQEQLVKEAASVLNGELVELIDTIRQDKEQTIDHDTLDTVLSAGWGKNIADNAQAIADEFAAYLKANQDNIAALTIFFSQPYRRRELSYDLIRQVLDKLNADKPKLAPLYVWHAYRRLDDYKGAQPVKELTALVTLIRRVCGMDETLTDFDATVRRNFRNWIMKHHSGGGNKFNEEQMDWLRMIRDHVANSFHIERDDLEMSPFDGQGGLGKMYQLFGAKMDTLMDELNEVLVA